MQYDFSGQRVIVTGAAHGFGRAIAQAFAGLGAAVWACDILNDEVRETCSLVKGAGGLCEARTVNVRKRAEVQDFVSEVSSDGKPVQVLVNNAGGVLGQVGRPLEEIDGKDWDSVLEVNLRAVFWMSQAVTPGMKQAGYGRIVNISSGAGLRPSMTGVQAYAAAKAAQIHLTRQLAWELGPWGITVNNIAPGFVRSNPTSEKQWHDMGAKGQRALIDSLALRRLGSPADIAHGVVFLASEHAGWVTGQVLPIDGGRL